MLSGGEQSRDDEAARLVREYFSAPEPPLCGRCGEELEFQTDYSAQDRLRVEISCPSCGLLLEWRQRDDPGEWKPVHLTYFFERTAQGQVPRCPYDDSGIGSAEFEEGVFEFRCPFCNRRGRLDPHDRSARLHLTENESIVFLTV